LGEHHPRLVHVPAEVGNMVGVTTVHEQAITLLAKLSSVCG
jgi:hypothetical protein